MEISGRILAITTCVVSAIAAVATIVIVTNYQAGLPRSSVGTEMTMTEKMCIDGTGKARHVSVPSNETVFNSDICAKVKEFAGNENPEKN
jgi:hypothetical protein